MLRVAAQRTQSSAGISAAQLFVLEQLRAGALSLNELAARTLTDRTSVAAVVERLSARRLVIRRIDPDDRRRASVELTANGRRVLARSPHAPMTTLMSALERLPPPRRASLSASLAELVEILGVAGDPAALLFNDEAQPRSSGTRNKPH
jgi:DNA-binding MarR family transcriptional regulator